VDQSDTGKETDGVAAPEKSAPFAIEEALAVLALGALVVLTFANVLTRYFTDQSFAITEEVSIFLMVAMTLAGASAVALRDAHIRIEYFIDTGSVGRRRALHLFSALASAAFFAVFAWLSGLYVWDEFRYGETSMALGVPRWWYSIWMPFFAATIVLRSLGYVRRLWRSEGAP
jgi:TRAP-type C4-dicarboxylate transport system permease small subunit